MFHLGTSIIEILFTLGFNLSELDKLKNSNKRNGNILMNREIKLINPRVLIRKVTAWWL